MLGCSFASSSFLCMLWRYALLATSCTLNLHANTTLMLLMYGHRREISRFPCWFLGSITVAMCSNRERSKLPHLPILHSQQLISYAIIVDQARALYTLMVLISVDRAKQLKEISLPKIPEVLSPDFTSFTGSVASRVSRSRSGWRIVPMLMVMVMATRPHEL